MLMYVCDLCKAAAMPDEIVFIDVMKGNDRYQFDLCERCYRKLFKNVKKRKAELGITDFEEVDSEEDN
jgi:hypothetical protein